MEKTFDDELDVEVGVLRPEDGWLKCPRCWKFHHVDANFDSLCDSCCCHILEGWSLHDSAPFIRENLEAQQKGQTLRRLLDVELHPPLVYCRWQAYKQLSSPSVQDRSFILGKIATQLQGTVMFDHFASISNQYNVLEPI